MARYCSAQDNVRTRQSPPYRETIRVNVLHGRKSMSCAKSVLPLFTGTSSETFRKVPDRVQIDTTLNRQNRVQNHPFIGRHRLLNRTAVISHIFFRTIRPTMRRYVEWDSAWMTDKSQAGGGALLNLGGHGFDMARFVTGEEPEAVSAVLSRQVHEGEVEDYALATLRTPSGILFHNEVGYTMPTWPANQTDSEQKVAGERLLLRQVPGGLQLLAPNRDEIIPQPEGWEAGYPRAVREALEAYGRGDPPPIPPSECAHAVRLIFDSYRAAGVH